MDAHSVIPPLSISVPFRRSDRGRSWSYCSAALRRGRRAENHACWSCEAVPRDATFNMDQLASPAVGVPLYEQGSNLDLTSAPVAEALAEEDEAVERYIPGLTSPSLFNLLPMVRTIVCLLSVVYN
jgi:hypothetical protein